jgi:hypothetical protein
MRAKCRLLTGFRHLRGAAKNDAGAAALIVAAVIAVVAFSALSIFLNKFIGGRDFVRTQQSVSRQGKFLPAVLAYYNNQVTHQLPCPDTGATPDGTADSCNANGTTTGVLPWKDLGLSQDDVVDPYGSYYTYVVSATARSLCTSVPNDFNPAAAAEVTGSLIPADDLTVSGAAGDQKVAFAVISHGSDQRGALRKGGGLTSSPQGTHEQNNAHGGTPSVVYADVYNAESGTSHFDDTVLTPSRNDLEKVCKSLTPGSALNALISENFDGGGTSFPDALEAGGAAPPTRIRTSANNGVASLAATTSYLGTSSDYKLSPNVRPLYVSGKWTPNADAVSATAGISIAVRATAADLISSTDDFNTGGARGLTFRFYESTASNAGSANHISIRDNGAALQTSTGT